jgi:hypothetical protein
MVRGLPIEPRVSLGSRIRVLPYFINNLAPGLRAAWIRLSRRASVSQRTADTAARLAPEDDTGAVQPACGARRPPAVVLNTEGILLGVVNEPAAGAVARRVMRPDVQTIRPDMTWRLARKLLAKRPYLLVTTASGRYLGVYEPPLGE